MIGTTCNNAMIPLHTQAPAPRKQTRVYKRQAGARDRTTAK